MIKIILEYFIVIILAYLMGSINSSIVVSKYVYGVDIRKFGSGNAGATNTLRTLGKLATILVIIGDLIKGILSVIIGGAIAGNIGMLFGGLFCILGHNWPVYFNFKGGKGILTSLGVVITIDWRVGLILTIVAISIIAFTRYVSLGSVIGCILLPFVFYFVPSYRDIPVNELLYFSLIISLLAIFRHRNNIVRLIKGNESKFGHKVNIK